MSDVKNIVVGVTGGIAAYKACMLVRNFKESGDDVRVVPTPNALKFVGAATFEALSGNPVSTEVFDAVDEVRHVRVGQEADLLVVAPATADFMARLAAGRADDLLTATALVATCPVVLAPAMHTEMWNNAATQANVATLRSRGVVVLEPAHGRLTGKDSGPGRMLEPDQIAQMARLVLEGARLPHDMSGTRMVVTAGGTQENVDPVRYIGNRSSGKQGFALADVAAHRGAEVTVIAGSTADLETPPGAHVQRVGSTREMEAAVNEAAQGADIIIMAAAVADFRPDAEAESKMKKGSSDDALSTIHLVENPDILAGLVKAREAGELDAATTIVGFAAETGDQDSTGLEYGREKLERKGCDFLMVNEVGAGKVFGQETNRGWLLGKDGSEKVIPDGSKHEVAAEILTAVTELRG